MSLYNYIDTPNTNLTCCICRSPFTDPLTTTACAHTFCRACILLALSHSQPQRRCPVCRTSLGSGNREDEGLVAADPIVKSLVDELVVECTHREEGCRHTCQRQLLARHLAEDCEWREDLDDDTATVTSTSPEPQPYSQLPGNNGDEEIPTDLSSIPELQLESSPSTSSDSPQPQPRPRPHSCSSQESSPVTSGSSSTGPDPRIPLLIEQNHLLRRRVESLETILETFRRDMGAVKGALGPWMRVPHESQRRGRGSDSIRNNDMSSVLGDVNAGRSIGGAGSSVRSWLNQDVSNTNSSENTSSSPSTSANPSSPTVEVLHANAALRSPTLEMDDRALAQYFPSALYNNEAHYPSESEIGRHLPSDVHSPVRRQMHRSTASLGGERPYGFHASEGYAQRHGHGFALDQGLRAPPPLPSTIPPLDLSTSLEGTLVQFHQTVVALNGGMDTLNTNMHSLSAGLDSLNANLDSLGRRQELALGNETMRLGEEVGGLRAGLHGLRMQVHRMLMERERSVDGSVSDTGDAANGLGMGLGLPTFMPIQQPPGPGWMSSMPPPGWMPNPPQLLGQMPGRMHYPYSRPGSMSGAINITKL